MKSAYWMILASVFVLGYRPAAAQAPANPAPPNPPAAPHATAQSEAGEPRATMSSDAGAPSSAPAAASPDTPARAAAPRTQHAAAAPATGPAGAKSTSADRLELGTATVTGDREQPKVMYIVPWKKSDIGDLSGKPMNSLLDEALAPVDRDEFKRQVVYYQAVKADASQNGAAKQPAPQGEK